MDDDALTSIRNIGPSTAAALARAGVGSAGQLRAMGAEAAYSRLLAAGEWPHFIAFYALAMGLQGRPWNDCRGAEKAALRARFDALVAARSDPRVAAREAALDALGVVARPRPAQPTSSRPEKK
ncbi:MAG: TfoX/Sxy family DNA transformation protein [Rhodobacteraceae bacterium]|jgi:hypothetical protein|nr:TfoX/Sxy family DNA transformation protein [Paracoccaceae bacterium]